MAIQDDSFPDPIRKDEMNRKVNRTTKVTNIIQTGMILFALFTLMCLLGYTLAGTQGVYMALIAGVLLSSFGPKMSNARILRTVKARQLSVGLSPGLHYLVEQMSHRAGLQNRPKIYLINAPQPNAFAIGNAEESAIVLSDSLLTSLNGREIRGIIGHELAHIRNNDLQVLATADNFRRITHGFAVFGQLFLLLSLPALMAEKISYPLFPLIILILSPTIGILLQLALSRTREFEADRAGAELVGDAFGLSSALQKIEQINAGLRQRFLPLPWQKQIPTMLSTHPATTERVARLKALSDDSSLWVSHGIPMILNVQPSQHKICRVAWQFLGDAFPQSFYTRGPCLEEHRATL